MSDSELLTGKPEMQEQTKLTSEEIVDLKLRLINDHELLMLVAVAWTREFDEKHKINELYSESQRLEWAMEFSADTAVILMEQLSLPGSEWSESVVGPEVFMSHIRIQDAARKSIQIPDEIVSVNGWDLPGSWKAWKNGLIPNPLLTNEEILLLQANGYDTLLKPGRI